MRTVRENDDRVGIWLDAFASGHPEWSGIFAGCTAAVAWPVSGFWRETAAASPGALILSAVRKDAATWGPNFDDNIVRWSSGSRRRVPGVQVA
jgi:hypothetical protein